MSVHSKVIDTIYWTCRNSYSSDSVFAWYFVCSFVHLFVRACIRALTPPFIYCSIWLTEPVISVSGENLQAIDENSDSQTEKLPFILPQPWAERKDGNSLVHLGGGGRGVVWWSWIAVQLLAEAGWRTFFLMIWVLRVSTDPWPLDLKSRTFHSQVATYHRLFSNLVMEIC